MAFDITEPQPQNNNLQQVLVDPTSVFYLRDFCLFSSELAGKNNMESTMIDQIFDTAVDMLNGMAAAGQVRRISVTVKPVLSDHIKHDMFLPLTYRWFLINA